MLNTHPYASSKEVPEQRSLTPRYLASPSPNLPSDRVSESRFPTPSDASNESGDGALRRGVLEFCDLGAEFGLGSSRVVETDGEDDGDDRD